VANNAMGNILAKSMKGIKKVLRNIPTPERCPQ
jgi:hypothetical protein